jgi:cytochrome c oxidase subunit 4
METARKHVGGVGYVVTFLSLVLLATLSLLLSFLSMPAADLAISLVIATCKALLVLWLFMHLAEQRFANRLVVLVSVIFVVLLVALPALDVATRHTFPARPFPPAGDRQYRR